MEAAEQPHRDGGARGGGHPARAGAAPAAPSPSQTDMLCMKIEERWKPAAAEGESSESAPIICTVCGREGHPCCGLAYWTALRAAWLRVKEEDVAREPPSFEHDGPLQLQQSGSVGPIRDLSDGEIEDLEDCLEAVQRPFPQLRKSIPLMQAIQTAEALWDAND